ncbi:MAG: D-alanyl-lipoteichoic acid biosynthesis protein DltD [Acidimicrobiales bacterium]
MADEPAPAPATTDAPDDPGARGGEPTRRRRRLRRPRHPILAGLAVLVAMLVVAELAVRAVADQLPVVRAGDAAEMILKARQVEALGAEGPQPQVVFFGTSMMDSAITPSTFVKYSGHYDRAYNAAVVGAPTATQVRWADEIVLDALHPDLVVLGIHPIDLMLTDVFELNIQSNQSDVIFSRVVRETQPGVLGDLNRSLNDNLAIVKHRGSLRQPQTMAEAAWNTVTGTPPKKYIPLRDEEYWEQHLGPDGENTMHHGEEYRFTSVINQLRKNLTPDAFYASDAQRLVEVAKASGAEVVIVVPPVPLATWKQNGVDLAALRRGQQIIADIGATNGVRVVDFTDRVYDESLFADIVHMNDRGADRFSRELAAELGSS